MTDVSKDWVRTNALRFRDSLALRNIETGEHFTWQELDVRVGALAGLLAQQYGIGPGDRVLLIAEGDTRTFEVQFASMRLGAIMVPLNWRLALPELIDLGRDVEPSVVIFDGVWQRTAMEVAAAVGTTQLLSWRAEGEVPDLDRETATATPFEPRTDLSDEIPTHILHTSGTTGRPKGAVTTMKTLAWQLLNTGTDRGICGPGTLQLNPMPLFHAGGLSAIANPVLLSGGAVATMRRFDPALIADLLGDPANGITHFTAPPVMWAMLTEQPGFADGDYSAIRLAEVAGGIPALSLLATWEAKGIVLQQAYGGTELGPAVTGMPRDGVAHRPTSCGRAVPFTHVRLVTADGADAKTGEVGEVFVKGPSITPGYWCRDGSIDPGRTEDGWFPTGDAARKDEDGYYYLVDRVKDMYKSGGENVFPAEVERVIALHHDVLDVAVVGVPHEKWGEAGRAFVVVRDSAVVTLEDVRSHCAAHIAKYKAPHDLIVVEDLPRNTTGKVSKHALREWGG